MDGSQPVITRLRHRVALEECQVSLDRALHQLRARGDVATETAAADLRDAADQLGAVIGIVTSDDVLDEIFSHFCIGK